MAGADKRFRSLCVGINHVTGVFLNPKEAFWLKDLVSKIEPLDDVKKALPFVR